MKNPTKPLPWPGLPGKPKIYRSSLFAWVYQYHASSRDGLQVDIAGPTRKTEAGAIKAWNRERERALERMKG